MEQEIQRSEKGQNIILVAIMMLFFIGLLALVLDGGMAYAKRRAAQNAADAGALAGANQLCALNPTDSPYNAAYQYAVTRNKALKADIQVGEKSITVTASMSNKTFFAQLLGTNVITETATASAGCFSPCTSTGVLPVAWACRSPSVNGTPTAPTDGCAIQYGTIDTPGPLYVIMDSNKAGLDYQCKNPPNNTYQTDYLDCDFINADGSYGIGDGVDDLLSGGGRSWLDLNGGSSNASELKDWVTGKETATISTHTWLPGASGNIGSVYNSLGKDDLYVGQIFLVPVFNDYTVSCDPSTDLLCISKYHTKPPDLWQDRIMASSGSKDYYHVASTSLFMITGIYRGKNGGKCQGNCTATNYLIDQCKVSPAPSWCYYPDPDPKNNVKLLYDDNAKTIEGYFIEGSDPRLSGKCDYDAGAYTIYLNH